MKYYVTYQSGGAKTKSNIFFKLKNGKYKNISQFKNDLKKKNNDYFVQSAKNNTYLHVSIKNYDKGINKKITKFLINKMANNLNLTNNNRRTVLHLAAKNKDKDLYDLLVKKGADEGVVDKFGKLPKDFFGRFFDEKSPNLEEIDFDIFKQTPSQIEFKQTPSQIEFKQTPSQIEFEELQSSEESDTSIEQIKSNIIKFRRNLDKILKN